MGRGQERALTSIADVRALSQAEAARGLPVQLQATVLIYDFRGRPGAQFHELIVHDGRAGIFVEYTGAPLDLSAGGKIELRGRSARGQFAPVVKAESLAKLGGGELPSARVVTMKDILSGREDCQWVEIEGTVRRTALADDRLAMVLEVEGNRVPVSFTAIANDVPSLDELVEARVAVRGAVTGRFNEQGQMTGVRLLLSPSPAFVRVLHSVRGDPFSRPVRAVVDVLERASDLPPDERVKVAGVVTLCRPGGVLFLSDGDRALMIRGESAVPVAAGDAVEVVGFREQGKSVAFLEDSTVRRVGAGALPQVREIDVAAALSGTHEAALVSLRARFVESASVDGEEVMLFHADGTPFTARMAGVLPSLHAGDAVRLTGICTSEDLPAAFGKHGWQPAFQILPRSPRDVQPLSWWTRERLLALVGAALAVVVLSLAWAAALRRRVRMQTAVIQQQVEEAAALEERSRIARELHDTLAQGFAGTAFALEGIATNLGAGDERLRPQIEMALRMVRHSLTEARRSVMNLRADALGNRDLATALDETARQLVAGHDVKLHADLHRPSTSLAPGVENEVFRIAIEAVTNALRHAKPRTLEIELRDSAGALLLRVRDDGAGFDPASAPANGHFGLVGMRERARHIGASLTIESTPAGGCEVRLVLNSPSGTA